MNISLIATNERTIQDLCYKLGLPTDRPIISLALTLRDLPYSADPGNVCLWGAACTNRNCVRDHGCQDPLDRSCKCTYEHGQRSQFFSCESGAACDVIGCRETHPVRGNVPCPWTNATSFCERPRCPFIHTSTNYKQRLTYPRIATVATVTSAIEALLVLEYTCLLRMRRRSRR
jgi:hypothetical protein